MKTAKFSEVVKRCGDPSIHLAWVDPARDKILKRALSEHRVMTLHQELHGGRKDFGSVGFLKERHAQLLVFPKSLRRFSDRKIIAVDYALIAKDQITGDLPLGRKQQKEGGERRTVGTVTSTSNQKSGTTAPIASKASPVIRPPLPLPDAKKLLAEVKRAVAELAAGKSVPAYERLVRLLATAH